MRFKSFVTGLVILWIVGFLLLNWQLVSAPAKLDFIFASVDTSVGVAMLAASLPPVIALIVYVGMLQSSVLLEARRQAKELQAQRTLADDAEASRITELGNSVRADVAGLEQRLQLSIDGLKQEFQDTERSLAATIAEMDDRIKRSITP